MGSPINIAMSRPGWTTTARATTIQPQGSLSVPIPPQGQTAMAMWQATRRPQRTQLGTCRVQVLAVLVVGLLVVRLIKVVAVAVAVVAVAVAVVAAAVAVEVAVVAVVVVVVVVKALQ